MNDIFPPTHRPTGTKVVLTRRAFNNAVAGNRSIKAYPSDEFLTRLEKYVGMEGVVTHDFTPSYERTIRFGNDHFHMKDHWVETLM
jgi:hypothetical protein